ncbi:MAG: hypothetical protein QOI38_1503, partial [Sphingomonadales bacterium]|nr:hypothetical protein [Sphingomonadales bacterium]
KVEMKPVNLTPEMALQLIREHERRQAAALKGTGFGPRPGRTPTVATSGEVQAALVRALRAYGDRLRAGDEGTVTGDCPRGDGGEDREGGEEKKGGDSH